MQAWSAGAAIVDGNARGSIQFLKYLELLAATAGDTATATQLAEIADRIEALEGESQANIVGTGSVSAVKSGNNWIVQLRGDNSDPNNGMLYGANEHGPGWLSVAEVFQPGSDFVVHDSGYLLLGVLDSEADLPGSSTLNDAYRVKSALWYWDGSDWVQDPSPSGVLELAIGSVDAAVVDYDNATSGLTATDAQAAIDELSDEKLDDAPSDGSEYVRKNGAWSVATGGGGSSSWTLLNDWDFATDGAVASIEADLSSYNECMVMVASVTLAASGVRGMQLSADGGSSYPTSYNYIDNNGVRNTWARAFVLLHNTADTAARNVCTQFQLVANSESGLSGNQSAGGAVFLVPAFGSKPNRVKVGGWTTAGVATNMTGGKVFIYGR